MKATLADHVVFRHLPFCGVLLDTRDLTISRLSPTAAHILAAALPDAPTPPPFGALIAVDEPSAADVRTVLAALERRGVIHRQPIDGTGEVAA